MTTLAYKDGILAADRQGHKGNRIVHACKIYLCGEFLFAECCQIGPGIQVQRWLASGADPKDAPRFDPDQLAAGIAFHLPTQRPFYVDGTVCGLGDCSDQFLAYGSGVDFAISAMAMGKSAPDAVEFASQFDVYTGGGVDSVIIEGDGNILAHSLALVGTGACEYALVKTNEELRGALTGWARNEAMKARRPKSART